MLYFSGYVSKKTRAFKPNILRYRPKYLKQNGEATTYDDQSDDYFESIEKSFTFIDDTEGLKVIALDGHGSRVVVQVRFLMEFERRTGKKIYEYFDLIIGTNTGALLAALICYLHYSAEDLMNVLLKYAQKVLSNSSISKFIPPVALAVVGAAIGDSKALDEFLFELFQDRRLDAVASPKLVITSTVDLGSFKDTFLFRNFKLEDGDIYEGANDATVVQALRASLATPTYFPAVTFDSFTLLDGAITANNPAEIGLLQAGRIWPNEKCSFLLSLGSGDAKLGNENESSSKETSRMISDSVFKLSDTRTVHNKITQQMLSFPDQLGELFYVRLQPEFARHEIISWSESDPDVLLHFYNKADEYLKKRLDMFVLMFENKTSQ